MKSHDVSYDVSWCLMTALEQDSIALGQDGTGLGQDWTALKQDWTALG